MVEITVDTLYHYPQIIDKYNLEDDGFLNTDLIGSLINNNNYNIIEIRTNHSSVYVLMTNDTIVNGDDIHFTHIADGFTSDHTLYNITIHPDYISGSLKIIQGGTFKQTWSLT